MKISPLQLEDYFLKELRFSLTDSLKSLPDRDAKYDNPDISINIGVDQQGDNLRRWRCELTVESTDKPEFNLPYRFTITYVGFFKVIEEYPAEHVELMARTNAPALLYSAAREALLPLTGRGHYPAIVLPSVTFLQPPKKEGAKEKDQGNGAPRKTSAHKGAKRVHRKRPH